jgi:TPR repeat protein
MTARAYFLVLVGLLFSECIFSMGEPRKEPAEKNLFFDELNYAMSEADYMAVMRSIGLPENAWPSLKAVEEASENQSSYQKYRIGLFHKNEKKYLLAALWFLQAANQDNGLAQFQLGVLFEEGFEHADERNSIKKDLARAGYHYSKSAKLGIYEARKKLENPDLARLGRQMQMNENYKKGLSLKQLGFSCYGEAFKLFQEAAREGHGLAKYQIGILYEEGFFVLNHRRVPNVIRNIKLANMHYKSAAELGVLEAQQKLKDLQCKICDKEYVTEVMPCEHTICSICGSGLTICPFCDSAIEKITPNKLLTGLLKL